jgi:GTP pyrophosphokinase
MIQNGDTIEIITSPQATPSQAWEEFAVTGKAKNAIRRFLREQTRDQYVKLGESLLKSSLTAIDSHLTDNVLEKILHTSKILEPTDLYYKIGQGDIHLPQLMSDIFPDLATEKTDINSKLMKRIPISGMIPGIAIHLGQCCYPLPGDNIVGIFKEEKGIQVHAIDCNVLETYETYPELWIDLKWEAEANTQDHVYSVRIALEISNCPGSLGRVASLIGDYNGNITNLTVFERKEDFIVLHIELDAYDLLHLQNILSAIEGVDYINSIERVRQKIT